MSDTLRNRRIAFARSIPVILGLEEAIDGTLLEYITQKGHAGLVVEGGEHDDPAAIDHHESVIWTTLVAAGLLAPSHVPDFAEHRRRLEASRDGLPRVLEVRHRHAIHEGDGFRMKPGYRGFQRVQECEEIAHDRHGPVRAPEEGRILMPLYQEQGSDGFFIVRPVSRFWLRLSAVLRRMQLHVALRLFPGVTRHPTRPDALRVNPHVARWLVVEIFHLFGYRRRRPDGDHLIFTRRPPG